MTKLEIYFRIIEYENELIEYLGPNINRNVNEYLWQVFTKDIRFLTHSFDEWLKDNIKEMEKLFNE